MKAIETEIKGVYIIKPDIYKDDRGYFYESFNEDEFSTKVCPIKFVQDNQSYSTKNVLRGLHFQKEPHAQSKLVRVTKGRVLDVAVDLRKNSETYGKYVCAVLSETNHKQLFIPKGFAHGFRVLSDTAIFQYKCDNYYNKESEGGIAWDSANINWGINKFDDIILSDKDINRIKLKDFDSPFIYNK